MQVSGENRCKSESEMDVARVLKRDASCSSLREKLYFLYRRAGIRRYFSSFAVLACVYSTRALIDDYDSWHEDIVCAREIFSRVRFFGKNTRESLGKVMFCAMVALDAHWLSGIPWNAGTIILAVLLRLGFA